MKKTNQSNNKMITSFISKKIFNFCVLSMLIISQYSCKKKTTPPTPTTTIGSDFFVEGKGLRKIWGMESKESGLGAFSITHITATPDNKLHTVFSYYNSNTNLNTKYRKLIDIATGDTSAIGAPPPVDISGYQEDNGTILMIPYTQQLGYEATPEGTVKGEASWMPVSNVGGFGRKIYKNNQIVSSYTYMSNSAVSIQTFGKVHTATMDTNISFVPPDQIYAASLDLTEAGQPLLFAAQQDKIQVYDFVTKASITSIPLTLFSSIYNYYISNNNVVVNTKRSQDNSKIIGLILDPIVQKVTTFVYNIATKTLEIKVNNTSFTKPTTIATTTFDEDGNIYYLPNQTTNTIQINKISPSGDAMFRTGFLKSGTVLAIKSVGTRLFVALGKDDNTIVSETKSKLLITEVQ
jgi:hypothetical protein